MELNQSVFLMRLLSHHQLFESVFSANRLKEFIMTEIIKPLKRNAESTTSNDEIIAPRLIPKKPLFQTLG